MQGCVLPETQTIGDGQKLEVSQTDYDAFVKKVTEAAKYAQEHKLGRLGVSHRCLMIRTNEEA